MTLYGEAVARLSPEALAHIRVAVAAAPPIEGEHLARLLELWDVPARADD
ncbi:hypothetical protein [Pseudonocardia sp. NPDC049154]